MKRVTLGAVLRECRRRGIRFAGTNYKEYNEQQKRQTATEFQHEFSVLNGNGSKFQSIVSQYLKEYNELVRALKSEDFKMAYRKVETVRKLAKECEHLVGNVEYVLQSFKSTIFNFANFNKDIDVSR